MRKGRPGSVAARGALLLLAFVGCGPTEDPVASSAPEAVALRRPLPRTHVLVPPALRTLQLDRQARGVAAEPGQPLRLEIPPNPLPGRGHRIWLGYARQGTVAEATLEVTDTSGPEPRLLERRELTFPTDAERWQDVAFSIPAQVTRLSVEVVAPAPAPRPPVVLSQPAVVPEGVSARRPNLVLVSIDTLRADFLNSYGYQAHRTSPHIDGWAERGVLFEQVIAPSPWTLPSHVAAFTGIDPEALGMDHLLRQTPRLAEARATLAELFQSAGYLTLAFTGAGPMAARNGFADGFHLYQETYGVHLEGSDLDTNTFLARRWLTEHAGEPFFLFLHTYEIHAPYRYGRYASPDLPPLLHRRARYASGIAYTDARLAEFLGFLDERGWMDDSLLVIMSDHGEGFADDHGVLEHGRTLYDEVLEVPLILAGPDIPPGRRVPEQVRLQDLFATLVEYFELPAPEALDSRSLLGPLRDEPLAARPAHLCCMAHDFQRQGLRKDGYKYIRSEDPEAAAPVEELFDLSEDPRELRNLAAERSALLESMRRETVARTTSNKGRVDGAEPLEIDEVYRQQLRALGYIE